MNRTLLQLAMAPIGSLGFALLFNLRAAILIPSSLGGLGCWIAYLLGVKLAGGIFVPTIISSAFCALYSEISARIFKAPATVFFIPALVPLIPGSTLYYTMSYLVQKDWNMAAHYGFLTGEYAIGIAAGACLVWVFYDTFQGIFNGHKKKL